MQRTSSFPMIDQGGPYRPYRHVLHHLSGRGITIFRYPRIRLKRSRQDPPSNTRLCHESYTVQMRIPAKQHRISGVHHWARKSQNRPSPDASHRELEKPQNNKGNSVFPRILQLVPTMYRSLQQNRESITCTNKKGVHRQMRVGKQETTSLQRIDNKTHHSTGTVLLRPSCTNQD